MTVPISPFLQFFDNNGNPLSGGSVGTFAAGTSTPLASYTDQTGGTANANPVLLDSSGRADIWLTANVPYKLVLKNSAGVVIDTIDNFYAGASPEQLTVAGIVPATGGTYTGPVNLNGGAIFGGSAAQDLATLDSLGIAAVQNANLWTNSDFAIWQRATASVADGAYGFDRVVNLAQTGSTTLSQLAQPADGMPYAMRITQPDASAKRIGFCQIVEAKDCLAYRGKNLAFAVRVRCSVSATVRAALVAWTGTADAPTRDVVDTWTSTNYSAGNFFVGSTLPIAVAAQAVTAATFTDLIVTSTSPGGVVVPSTMTNLYMVVWTETAQAQNVTLDASIARCGQGTEAPLWTPPNAQQELAKCQRFYSKSYSQGTAPGTATPTGADQGAVAVGGGIAAKILFPVVMRTVPAVSVWSNNGVAGQWVAFTSGGAATSYAATPGTISDRNASVALTVGASEVLSTGQWVATADL